MFKKSKAGQGVDEGIRCERSVAVCADGGGW